MYRGTCKQDLNYDVTFIYTQPQEVLRQSTPGQLTGSDFALKSTQETKQINVSCFICFTDDLSYNKLATQSHTVIGTDYAAGNAVDRNSTTCMRTRAIGRSSPDKTVWWRVDLGRMYGIYSINVLFRTWDGYGTCTSFLFTFGMIFTILIYFYMQSMLKTFWWKVDLCGVYNI